MKISGDKSDLSISQAGTGAAAVQCEDPTKQLPVTQLPGPLENMDSSHNGELTAAGTEDASEGPSVIPQSEGSSQTVTNSEDAESKPEEIVKSQNPETEKESESKDLKTTDLSSDDEVKRDSSKKKSKKHKKHKNKKKKKKKKKEKNEKRSKSTSSVEDQENASPESKSVWKPVISSPREKETIESISSQMEENGEALPSLGVQDQNVDSGKEQPARPQLDMESGFFGPKCPSEMHFPVSSNLTVCEVEMAEPSKELAVDGLQNDENSKCIDHNNEKQHTNCVTAEAIQNEISLPQPGLVLSQEKSIELEGSRLSSEGDKDLAKQSDGAPSIPSQPQSNSASAGLSKSTAKSRSRSNSLARENRSRSKSLTKVPKKQASSKSLTKQRSRSSSVVRRQRSRSSSVGQRRRSKSKSPIRRRRSQSSSPVRYSKSPVRSWWSKSIRNRQRSVSIERRRRSRTRSPARRRRSRSSEKGSRTRSSAKGIRSRSRSANRRRKSRSTSRKRRLRSRSASRRKSKSRSPSRKRRSKSASPIRRQKSKTSSPVRRGRSRSRSAVQKRRSRSGAATRRQRSRSASGSRRRKSRSGSFTRRRRSGSTFRRRRSRSAVASRRRRSRSPSVSRRRRSRSPSVSRRRRSRSPSVSRRRRSRSPSVSRRRRSRSPSVSRRRRSRSPSVSRRRRTRSPSVSRRRRTRSPSVSRRRRSRSTSVSRRRRSRSPSVSRRRRSRSASRRRRSRSASRRRRSRSASRRRRSRSALAFRRNKSRSASRRGRSRSDSVSKRESSKLGSASRRRKSRSNSNTRRPRSSSDSGRQRQKSPSSATRKSRSPSVAVGEKTTLLSSTSKVEDSMSNSLERGSRSKENDQKSESIILESKSVESEPPAESKSSPENGMSGTMSLDEKQLSMSTSTVELTGPSLSTVEKHNEMKLPDTSSSCCNNAVELESNVLDGSTTTSVMDDHMKSMYSECPTELNNTSDITECDMEIEPISLTPIETNFIEHSAVNLAETSAEVDDTNEHGKVVDLRADDKQGQKILGSSSEDGTVCGPFGSSPDFVQLHGLSQLAGAESSHDRPTDPTKSSFHSKPHAEVEPEFVHKGSDSACKTSLKATENSADHIATSTNVKLSSTDPLPNCLEIPEDPESIKSKRNVDTDVVEIKYLTEGGSFSNAGSDQSCLTVKQDLPGLLAESQNKSLHSALPIDHMTSEGKPHVSPMTSNNKLDLLSNEQGSTVTNSITSNENQNVPALGKPSSIVPGGQKCAEEASASMLNDNLPHQGGTLNFKSSTLAEDIMKQSYLKEKQEMQCLDAESNSRKRSKSKEKSRESSQSEEDLQRKELKLVKNILGSEEGFSSPLKRSSSRDLCISNVTENTSASDNTKHVSKDIFKETDESEVSKPIEKKTKEVKPVKESRQSSSSMNVGKDLSSTCLIEESNSLPDSSKPNTSLPPDMCKLNVHSLPKRAADESTVMEEISASKTALQNSQVSPNADYHELSRSKEPTTLADSSITNFPAQSSPSILSLSTKISDSTSEKNSERMSVTSAKSERHFLTDSSEEKIKNQRLSEVPSNTNNAESSLESKTVSKASSFNSCTKREGDKFLSSDAVQLESSANSISSSDPDVICLYEKTGKSGHNSSRVLQSEKQCPSTSKSSDGNLEKLYLGSQEKELSQNIVKNMEIDECGFGDYIPQRDTVSKQTQSSASKDSESECLTNSTDDKIPLNAVNANYNNQEKSVKAIPKNEERVSVEEEISNKSFTEVKEPELETQEKSAPKYSKPHPTFSALGESKPLEDPKFLPQPFTHETGRLSMSSMPFQFKFSKTFKTLGVSQLCSASEDSSDVEISKVNASSSNVMRNNTSTSDTARSSSKTSSELQTTRKTASISVEPSKSSSPVTEASQSERSEPSPSDHQSEKLSEKDLSQPDNLQAADDSQTDSSTKHSFPYISNAASKLGVKQRQYRSRSVAQDSRTPSVDRGHASRSRSKSLSRRRRSHSKSSSRKKRSESSARKKSSHSKSVRKKRSRSRSRGRKGRSQSKSKGKKKRSSSKLSAKRKRSRSKSSQRVGGSKSSGKQRSSRSASKTRKNRSPEKKGRSRSKSEARKNLRSKTASTRRRSQSKSPNRRRKSLSKSISSRSRSRSVSASWKRFSQSKSSLHRKRSRSSSRSASPKRRSRSRNKRRSFSRSPIARSNSRSRSRWNRSRSRGRWRRSRSLSTSRRRSRSTSRLSSSLSSKKRKSLSPVRRRRSRSQIKQKDKSPVSKLKSTSPPPLQKKIAQAKPAGFKHSIGLKSLIQKQLSQAKSQGATGKLSKEPIPLSSVSSRTKLSIFSIRTQPSMSNLSTLGQIPVPNLAEVPLPSVSASQVPMPNVPPADPLSVSSLAAETQLSVPDLTAANQWHVPDMSGGPWSVPDIAAGTQWSMADLGTGTQWPMSDLTAGSHWPMHDLSVGAQWSMPDLAAGTQWAVPDVATGAQWAVPDLTAGTQWTVPDLTAGSQWAMTNMAAGAQWAVPDLASTAQWTVPDLTAGAQIQRADLAPEAQVPGSDLAPEAQVPGSDLATEAQVPGSDLAAEAQVPGSDMVAEAQVPLQHDLISEEHNVIPDVAAEALVPVASSTIVPDVAAGIPLPDVTATTAQMPRPDVTATILMPDVATEAQRQMSEFVSAQAYMSLSPEESEDSSFREPVVSSERQTESDSGDASVQQSSFEPVNTSQNIETEETLSSGQQLAEDCFENSKSTEVNNETISLDKHDLQVNQEPVTDLLSNLPQVEPTMDSECLPSSEPCRPSDVPLHSCESSDYSVQSISVESGPMQEHSLTDCHKSSDISLQCETSASASYLAVEYQSNSIPTVSVEPSGDQPLLAGTNSMPDDIQKDKPCDGSDPTLMEQADSNSVCPKLVAPHASPENILQNEPSVNTNTTLEINSDSISDLNETEVCTPNSFENVELNSSLGLPHPTERHASPEHPQLVEPYTSPDHPQLVEPYTSPVRPQLVEPYVSPQHTPLVELYSSPVRPQLVEPYASPDFPQLVEPYASPDRQHLDEPYSNTEHTQTSMSPVLTENRCSPAENPEELSISGHILTYATVTCTEINTDDSCSDGTQIKNDFSLLPEHPVTSDVPKNQAEIIDLDYPQFSKSDNASASLQEVPCPSLLKAYSLESSCSPKETTAEDCSSSERELVEPSTRSHLEHSTIPAQLSTEIHCSPHTVYQEESSITEQKPLDTGSPKEQILEASCVTTSPQHSEECATAEHSQSKELYTDLISSEQVQEKVDIIQVPSPSISHTNEQCLSAEQAPIAEYEHPTAEDQINHPDENLHVPVLSNTIINFDPSCNITPSPDRPEQETITEHSLPEESKATPGCDVSEKLLAAQVVKVLDKPSPSSDPAVHQDSQNSWCSSPSKELTDCHPPEHSFNADHSAPLEYPPEINQCLDQPSKAQDSNASVFQSQEIAVDRPAENPLPSETASLPADLPPMNKDELQCSTPNQASELSVECMKHKPEDSDECIETDNHFTTTPPDLLPYDTDQPTDMCAEPSSEPVPFNSQPPPELLPYDSEQPANSFLGISELSAEQGSSDFYAPPELLPYDSDQPIVEHSQQKEPTGEELAVYDSPAILDETYRTLPSVDPVKDCGNGSSLNIQEISEKCESSNETVSPRLSLVKEVSSECAITESASTEQTFTLETLQENSVPSAVVDCTQEYPSPEQPAVEPALASDIPEPIKSRVENQTELTPSLTNTPEVQSSSSCELNASESELPRVLPLMEDEISLEKEKSSPHEPLTNTESPQLQPAAKTDPVSELKSGREHSRSRSIERKKSRSTSASQNKRSRSKSVTPTKKSHSTSLVKSRRSKSRSASTESSRRSPSVVKRKESTYVARKRSSRSASGGRKRRSRSSSLSPRKRSPSPSVGRKRRRSQSRQRRSRSASPFRKRSRSPSVTGRRRSRSFSGTRKRLSPSTSTARKKSSSPVTRRRRSPSATRRRRSPSPATRRRRTPSPTVSRRRRSPSTTRRKLSRSPSATRRRRSPSATRRRRSPSTSATRRRRSPSTSVSRRRRSPSPATTRRRRSPSPAVTRRRRSPSPSASRRRRSPSSELRRKRSPSLSVSRKRHSRSPSIPRKRRSRSTSASRRRRSRSASQRKRSRSPSVPRKRRSKSKSPSKSPTGIQSKSDRSRSVSQSEASRKRKTQSRSSSRDKKTAEKRRKRSSSKDSSKDYYSVKQRRKSRTPPRRKKSRSPGRRASVCKSPVRRRRSRSPVRRKSFSRSPIRRKRSRSRDKSMDSARSPKRLTDLDKAQLLEIAKANAAAMCAKAGVPLPLSLKPATASAPADDKITNRTYGVTIQELTEKCKQIASSKEDDVIVNKPHDSDDEEEDRPFYNHPFKVSEHKPISFSLLNPSLKPAPKTQVTLTKEFPVSSGSQHRKKESDKVYGEWVPVDKNTEESKDDVFTNTGPAQPVDITSAMNERAVAQTRLTGNPYDVEALYMLNRAQEQIDAWAQSTSIPGQFTGSTGAQVLSAEEISISGPQAWFKKDQFLKAAPVSGGRGALLMRRMGWKEGEGLGRNNAGNVDPILVDFKTDRKGLVADGEKASNKLALPAMKDLSGKHPISALMELCNKKKWSPPEFELVDDTGPEHRKRFLFRVTVNGVLCQPSQPSVTKKLAKATAAAAALQALGALPKESITSTSNFCSASSTML